jgi:hypothetical protein
MLQLCFQVVLFEEGKGHVVVNALICKVEQTRSEVAIFPKSASAKKAVKILPNNNFELLDDPHRVKLHAYNTPHTTTTPTSQPWPKSLLL